MKTLNRKIKTKAMHGHNQRRVKTVTDGELGEQVSVFKYFGCKISNDDMNTDLEKI
jgi:hypothetical protein